MSGARERPGGGPAAAMGFAVHGQGPTTVALHGGLLSGRLAFGPVAAEWGRRLRLLVADRRGFERTPEPREGSIDDQAGDLLALIERHGPGGRAHVVGWSIGGVVAASALQREPSRFRSLSLLEAPVVTLAVGDPEVDAWARELGRLHERVTATATSAADLSDDVLGEVLATAASGSLERLRPLLRDPEPGVTLKAGDLRPWATSLDAGVGEAARRAGVPVQVVCGELTGSAFRRAAQRAAAVFHTAVVEVAGAGHRVQASPHLVEPLRAHIARAEAAAEPPPIALSDHDPAWAGAFADERDAIAGHLDVPTDAVAHIGSTAVPGVAAKPIIDVLVGVADPAAADDAAARLEGLGYAWWRDDPDRVALTGAAGRNWLVRSVDGRRTHHVHLAVVGGAYWDEQLAFRDALRADDELARRYTALKRRLAADAPRDRERYARGKSAIVARAVTARLGAHTPRRRLE